MCARWLLGIFGVLLLACGDGDDSTPGSNTPGAGGTGATGGQGGSGDTGGSSGNSGSHSGTAGESGNAGAAGEAGASGSAGASGAGGLAGTAGTGGTATGGSSGAAGSMGGSGGSVIDVVIDPPAEPVPPSLPVFSCPNQWQSIALTNGASVCEPSPLPDWVCPATWQPTSIMAGTDKEYQACEPGPLTNWQCPVGWDERIMLQGTPQQYSICEPPTIASNCPLGTMPVLGSTQCEPLGDTCPSGDYPENLPGGVPVVYVKAGAPGGGTGTINSPYSNLTTALNAVPNNGIVAIGKGTYTPSLTVGAGRTVTLWGACVSGVTLQTAPAGSTFDASISAIGNAGSKANLTVKNLRITGQRTGILTQNANVTISGVAIDAAMRWGVLGADGSNVTINGLSITNTAADGTGALGRGLDFEVGAQAVGSKIFLDSNTSSAIFAYQAPTHIELSDVIATNTKSQASDQTGGTGINYQGGATITVSRGLFASNRSSGISGNGAGSVGTFTDIVVRDTLPIESTQTGGEGITLLSGAAATVTQGLIEHNLSKGISVWTNGNAAAATLTLVDSAVLDTGAPPVPGNASGIGVHVYQKAQADLQRVILAGNHATGVSATGAVTANLTDIVVSNTLADASPSGSAEGLEIGSGANVTVQNAFIDNTIGHSISVASTSTQANLINVRVSHTLQDSGVMGQVTGGLIVASGASVTVNQMRITESVGRGVSVTDMATSLQAQNLIVQGTTLESDIDGGYGVSIIQQAQATLSNTLVDTSINSGVIVGGIGTTADLSDIQVYGTYYEDGKRTGNGITVQDGADVTVNRALLDYNMAVGIAAVNSSSLDLHDAVMRNGQHTSDGTLGRALDIENGTTAYVERVFADNNHEVGIYVANLDGPVEMNDIVVQNTQGRESDGLFGRGLYIVDAFVIGERWLFDGNHDVSVFGTKNIGTPALSLISATDVTILNSLPLASDGTNGMGISVIAGAGIELTRGSIESSYAAGIFASDADSSINLTDVRVHNTVGQQSNGLFGRGITCQTGASIELSKVIVDSSSETGIAALNCVAVNLTDLQVLNTKAQPSDDQWGDGVMMASGTGTLTRVSLKNNRVAGLLVFASDVTLESVAVEATTEGSFTDLMGELVTGVADGAFFTTQAQVTANRVKITNVGRAGLLLSDANGTANQVLSENNVFGLVLQNGASLNYSMDSSFSNNQTPVLQDGMLDIPDGPPDTQGIPGGL